MWDLIVSVPDHCLSFYSECVTHHHIARIIILVLLHFLSLANSKIFKIAAKLVILVAILYSILDF